METNEQPYCRGNVKYLSTRLAYVCLLTCFLCQCYIAIYALYGTIKLYSKLVPSYVFPATTELKTVFRIVSIMNPIVHHWQQSLHTLHHLYVRHRPRKWLFFPLLFLFFVVINTGCYWWAMFTAFPNYVFGDETWHYFKVQFPVGFLGALFDSLSFFITVFIIRQSLRSTSSVSFVAHLSIDLLIAVVATFWVVFVFSFSGWLVGLTEATNEVLAERNAAYTHMVIDAIERPTHNVRNIYFGLIMGLSAMIPTCMHIAMALWSLWWSVSNDRRALDAGTS